VPDWISPDQQWPVHPDPDARKALDAARRAAWWFKPSARSGHIFGTLTCTQPVGDRLGDGNCAHRVFSTAGDSGETAKVIRRWLDQCTHRFEADSRERASTPEHAGRIDAAHQHMDDAEGLLDAADRLANAAGHHAHMDELFNAAESNAREAESLPEEAVAEDDLATAAFDEARQSAYRTGLAHDPWPPPEGPEARLVGPARDFVDAAGGLLAGQPGAAAAEARHRLEALQHRLGQWSRPNAQDP
jgi:hypothetical protein